MKMVMNSKNKARKRRQLLERDGDRCHYCGEPLGQDITLEHILDRSKGGGNQLSNLALAHNSCNRVKAAAEPWPFSRKRPIPLTVSVLNT